MTSARVLVRDRDGTIVIDRTGNIDTPAASGIVSLALLTGDWGAGKLQGDRCYDVEIETLPGPITHPDSGYEKLAVSEDLD